jgi:hypothetical protein
MGRNIVVFCVLGIVACTLCSCTTRKTTCKVDRHNVEIIETSMLRSRPVKSSHTVVPDGMSVLTYDSGAYDIRLEGEVLTVNGARYILPKKDDAVRIENGQVEINGKAVKPVKQ